MSFSPNTVASGPQATAFQHLARKKVEALQAGKASGRQLPGFTATAPCEQQLAEAAEATRHHHGSPTACNGLVLACAGTGGPRSSRSSSNRMAGRGSGSGHGGRVGDGGDTDP